MVLAYAGEQAEAIRVTDPLVRRNAPDSVHAMRVACRRMRSTMQSFRLVLERDRTDHLVDELRWLAGQLGGARDLEVQEQRIGAAVSALPPELAMGPVAVEVTRFFARRGGRGVRSSADLIACCFSEVVPEAAASKLAGRTRSVRTPTTAGSARCSRGWQ